MMLLKSKVQLPDAQHAAVRVDSVIDPGNVTFSVDAKGAGTRTCWSRWSPSLPEGLTSKARSRLDLHCLKPPALTSLTSTPRHSGNFSLQACRCIRN